MKYNHSKLLGRIRECALTQSELAKRIGINKSTLNAKLNNQFYFNTKEILAIGEALNIPMNELGDYFFTV
jgi:DNA-binding XRE family transcriptional regulator